MGQTEPGFLEASRSVQAKDMQPRAHTAAGVSSRGCSSTLTLCRVAHLGVTPGYILREGKHERMEGRTVRKKAPMSRLPL